MDVSPSAPRVRAQLVIRAACRPRCGLSLTTLIQLVVLLPTLFPANTSAGSYRWTTSGPADEDVRSLAIDPSAPATLYAGTGQGVFKSINGGQDWTVVNTGLTDVLGVVYGVNSLVIDPSAPA